MTMWIHRQGEAPYHAKTQRFRKKKIQRFRVQKEILQIKTKNAKKKKGRKKGKIHKGVIHRKGRKLSQPVFNSKMAQQKRTVHTVKDYIYKNGEPEFDRLPNSIKISMPSVSLFVKLFLTCVKQAYMPPKQFSYLLFLIADIFYMNE